MKLLAFSDLHRDTAAAHAVVNASAEADVIVGAGDFATRGVGANETLDILKTARCPVVIVSGNHDSLDALRAVCRDWDDGHLLHGDGLTIDGTKFFGIGCEIPHRNDADWNEALSEDDAARLLAPCPANAVLVTHTPPLGHADAQKDGTHEGSEAVLAAIENTPVSLVLCGHIHAAWGTVSMVGKTPIHNLGPTINWFEL